MMHVRSRYATLGSLVLVTLMCIPLPDARAQETESPWGFGGFPIIFYSEETRWAFGAGGQLVHQEPGDPFASGAAIGVYYSQNKQYNFSIGGEIYQDGKDHRIGAEFAKVFWPDVYYGIGNAPPLANEEHFTSRITHLNLSYQYRVWEDLYAGVQFYYNNTAFSDLEPNRSLLNGTVIGSRGGSLPTFGLLVSWDSRDNNVYPSRGSLHQLKTYHGGSLIGNEYAYSLISLDYRQYESFSADHVLAIRGYAELVSGQRPFYQMSRLGAYLRGYFQPRYRDRNLLAFQAEYRLPVFWRFGAVGFAGFGQVAPSIGGFALKEIRPSLGFGLRFALIPDQKVNLRIDLGIGKGDSTMDINIMEMF